MTAFRSCAFTGSVVHKRLAPKPNAFTYSVFALLLDLDEIDDLSCKLRLFSRNRLNLLSFYDRDVGAGNAEPVAVHIRRVLSGAGLSEHGLRISLLCYPRMFGYAFNPLSVYFCYGAHDRLGVIIYEVSNTFAERKSYVIPVDSSEGVIVAQSCAKEMYVSPFTNAVGRYEFHVLAPSSRVVVGVDLRGPDGPTLKTHFRGDRLELTDAAIVRLLARYPLMTLKVVAGIHLEAARLWRKGVPLVERHQSASYSFTVVKKQSRDASHVQ